MSRGPSINPLIVISTRRHLQDLASVKKAADAINEKYSETGIYCLANNAGVMMLPDLATKDGFDVQMQTNHLSHFLLTMMLLPALNKYAEANGEARVVSHSSLARRGYSGNLKKLENKYFEKKGGKLGGNSVFGKFGRYAQTKLSNAVFAYALKDYLEQKEMTKIKSVVCHPGIAKTGLDKDLKFEFKNIGSYLFKRFIMQANYQAMEDGALGIIKCICQPDVESGDFFGPGPTGNAYKGDATKFTPEAACTSDANKKLLWAKSEEAISAFTV